jgi:hypothetical protein
MEPCICTYHIAIQISSLQEEKIAKYNTLMNRWYSIEAKDVERDFPKLDVSMVVSEDDSTLTPEAARLIDYFLEGESLSLSPFKFESNCFQV